MQNTVQSTGVLYPEDEIVYIAAYSTSMTNDSLTSLTGAAWTNLGALSDFSRDSKVESAQPPSQNVDHDQIITSQAETINLTIQELNQANYNQLLGGVAQAQAVTGSSTATTDTYAAGLMASTVANTFVPFKNQSWSTTSATIPIVPTGIFLAGSSTYVLGTAYQIVQDPYKNWGVTVYSTGPYTSTQAMVLSYSYMRKAQSVLWHGDANSATPFMLKVYSVYSDGRTITTYYPSVNYISGGAVNDKKTGEFKDMKFTLEAREHKAFTYTSRKQFRVDIQTTA